MLQFLGGDAQSFLVKVFDVEKVEETQGELARLGGTVDKSKKCLT